MVKRKPPTIKFPDNMYTLDFDGNVGWFDTQLFVEHNIKDVNSIIP